MRPRIHGWIICLLLVGAGGLALCSFLTRGKQPISNSSPAPGELSHSVTAGKQSLAHEFAPISPAEHAAETPATSDAPAPFDRDRFGAWAKRHQDNQKPAEPQSFDALAALRDNRPGSQVLDRPPTPGTGTSSEPVIQIAYEAMEPAQAAKQDPKAKKSQDQRSASQTPRPVSTASTQDRPIVQQSRIVQVPEPGQVPANIGQVDVQALDQLGVVILRGSPQDVEAMKKIIEEIQRISEGVEPYVRVFQLHRAPATQVRDRIQELYGGSTSTTTGAQRTTTTTAGQPGTTGQQGAQAAPAATSVVQTPALRRFQITADDRSNTLVVLASPQMMEELSRLIERLDADGAPTVNEVRVFPLKNAGAEEVANILTQAISGQAAGTAGETIGGTAATVAGGGEVRVAKRTAVLKFVPAEGEGRIVESGILDEVRVTATIRTNSVIVSAPSSSMPLLASIIAELDKPPALVATMKVIELKNADATNMRTTLQELFDLEPTTTTGAFGGGAGGFGTTQDQIFQRPMAVAAGDSPPVSIRVAVDERTNSLIVSGPENAVLQVEAVIRMLDLSDIHNRKSSVYRLKNAYAIDVASTLTQFFTNKRTIEGQAAGLTAAQGTIVGPYTRLEQDVVVVALDNSLAATLTTAANVTTTATPNTQGVSNLLLISASPRHYDQVIDMINQLDAPQPQVMIQCIIAQLTLNDDFEFGIEFGLQNDVLFQRGNVPFTSASTVANTTAGVTTATNANAGILPGNPGFPFNDLGSLGNANVARPAVVGGQGLSNFALGRASLIDGLTNVGGLVLTASSQNISAMLRALQNDGHLEIISRPQIMTLDGRTARVQVGEQFPYVGEVTTTTTSTTPIVEYASIGTILTVKPSITPDDRIYLEIVPEVSELKELVNVQQVVTTTGVINQQAPRITLTSANTVVSVNDGQTVVLGGLIQKRHLDFMRKIPWLGDLPYIGCLFRFTQQRELRQELLLIMTPHIVRNAADVQRIKDLELARVNWVLNHTPEMHGDLGLTEPAPAEDPESEAAPTDLGLDSSDIRPMSGEEPMHPSAAPADWLMPTEAATSSDSPTDAAGDAKRAKWSDRMRRAFRQP